MDEFPHSVAPPPSSHHVRSFASRADGHRGTISSSADPSLESLTSSALLNRSGMTIRAVTPDPEVEVEDEADDVLSETHAHVTATPPRTPSRTTLRSASKWDLLGRASPELGGIPSSPDKPRSALSTTTVVAASQFADLPINRAKSRSPIERSRSKTTTEDNRPPPLPLPMDPSPPASVGSYVSRHRFHASRLDNDQAPSSMGYPWTQSAPVLPTPHQKGSIGSKSGRKYLRNQGSYNTLQPRPSCDPRYFPMNVEYAALVQLMKAVQGRMEGYVDYQIGHTGSHWTKGYCYIDVDSGSFMYQKDENGGSEPATTIISDLRGCQVMASTEDPDTILEIITHSGKQHLTLRPHSVQHFDCWLAALLCWKPIRPAGVANKLIKPHTHILAKERRRRNSDATVQNRGDVSLIKVGRMMLWFPERVTQSTEKHRPSNKGKHPYSPIAWQNVSCMLEDTGEFRLQLEHDTFPLQVLQLSQMSRCAVQQLDPSILDQEFCIALYPQYSHVAVSNTIPNHNPVYLCVDTRTAFEAWFVLLRAFTLPEIYGPLVPPPTPDSATNETVSELKNSANVLTDSYRIQRSIFIRVVEAKVNAGYYPNGHEREPSDCYAEVHLDTELRAKTMVRTKTRNPFWREDYEFCDLPTALTDISVVLKQRDPRQRSRGLGTVAGSSGFGGGRGGMSLPGSQDAIIGRVNVTVDELKEEGNRIEGWMPLMSVIKEGVEERVGELYARVEIEELTVLMASEYNVLSKVNPPFSRIEPRMILTFLASSRVQIWTHLAHGESHNRSASARRYPSTDFPGQ